MKRALAAEIKWTRNTSLWPAVSNVFAIAINPIHTGLCLYPRNNTGVPQMRWKIVSMCSGSSNLLRCPIWHPLPKRLGWKGMQHTHTHTRIGKTGESGLLRNSSNPRTITHTSCLCMLACFGSMAAPKRVY